MRNFCVPAIFLALLIFPSLARSGSRAPDVIYEIFPRSFQDSDGDGIGDLAGIISRLDYLNDGLNNGKSHSLGVDAIWLTPIFESPSYHGYDVIDYEKIDASYGDPATFQKLLTEAHRRGIKVFLDMAVNHTSVQHPWFISSSRSQDSPDRGLYLWSPEPVDWPELGVGAPSEDHWHDVDGDYYFDTFGNGSDPDLNWRNPEVLSRIQEVFRHWAGLGVDGFRLDAAKFLVKGPEGQQNLPETHQIWQQIVASTREVNPDAYFVGEVWDSAQAIATYYGGGHELDSCFDFPLAAAIRASLAHHDSKPFFAALEEHLSAQATPFFTSPIIGNHDMDRVASVADNDAASPLLKLAALAQLTLPGTPTIYYGDEIGIPMNDGSDFEGDLSKRTPMQWAPKAGGFTTGTPWLPEATDTSGTTVAEQELDPTSLLATYRELIHLRRNTPELLGGELAAITEPQSGVVSYARVLAGTSERSAALIVLNFSADLSPAFSIPNPLKKTVTIRSIFGAAASASADPATITFPAGIEAESGAVFLLQESRSPRIMTGQGAR